MTWMRVLGLLLIVAGVVYAVLYARWLRRWRNNHTAAGRVADAAGLVTDTVTEPAVARSSEPAVWASVEGPSADGPTTAGPFADGPTSLATDEAGQPGGYGLPSPAKPIVPVLPARPLTLAWVEGTYLRTNLASSPQERVAAAGLGGRGRATMVVDDRMVRWERRRASEIRVPAPRLIQVSLGRSATGRLPGRPQPVLVSWTGDHNPDHDDAPEPQEYRDHGHDKGADRYVTGFLPRSKADSAVLVSAVERLMKIRGTNDDAPTTPDGNP